MHLQDGREGKSGEGAGGSGDNLRNSRPIRNDDPWRGRDEYPQGTAGRALDFVVAINQRTNVQTREKARKQTPLSLSAAHF